MIVTILPARNGDVSAEDRKSSRSSSGGWLDPPSSGTSGAMAGTFTNMVGGAPESSPVLNAVAIGLYMLEAGDKATPSR